jgi:hypothetical protein
MTAHCDAYEQVDDWLEEMVAYDCGRCEYFKRMYCDGMDSDHYGHMLMPDHPACGYFNFKEKY